jgi:hypothetical protein
MTHLGALQPSKVLALEEINFLHKNSCNYGNLWKFLKNLHKFLCEQRNINTARFLLFLFDKNTF